MEIRSEQTTMTTFFIIFGIFLITITSGMIIFHLIGIRNDLREREDLLQHPPRKSQGDESLREFTEQMRERMSRERDYELAAYAEKKRKHQMIPNPLPTMVDDGRVHSTNPKAENILIPEGLSEEERAVLKDFFNL